MSNIQISNKNDLELIEDEIIRIYQTTDTGEKVVDGRELHKYLNVGTRFNDWIDRKIGKFGFEESLDFYSFLSKKGKGRPSTEYVLTLDMAKELGMLQENEEGKRIRKYFIKFEKRGRELLNNMPQTYPEALRELASAAEEKQRLKTENQKKEQIIGELKPKADYTDKILNSDSLVTITQIAKDYGMSGQAMNSLLNDLGVQYKQGDQWLLYAKHQGKGYTHSKTIKINENYTKMHTQWTQKGRLFLYNLLKENGYLPVIEKEVK